MSRILGSKRQEHGIALIATLALLVVLTMMIATVLQGNVAQRRYVRLRREEALALCLAESGLSEAIRAIMHQSEETVLQRTAADSEFHVEWHEERTGTAVYEIHSVGVRNTDGGESARRMVTVRALVRPGETARILSWDSSSRR